MLVYRTVDAVLIAADWSGPYRRLGGVQWDNLFTGGLPRSELQHRLHADEGQVVAELPIRDLLPPIGTQEVWAAGVTYLRSRTARMEESSTAGGSSFYDLVYNAVRPELFFKATPHRVRSHGQPLALRTDSTWMVPEPEATLAFDCSGKLIGFTIGNDLSSRDIEGQNPLYLPQAKTFDGCAALGPGLFLSDAPPSPATRIEMAIRRRGNEVFSGCTEVSQMKQTFENLCEHLFRCASFPSGCYLMTGTGIVPGDSFTLRPGDVVEIAIEGIGTLTNTVARDLD